MRKPVLPKSRSWATLFAILVFCVDCGKLDTRPHKLADGCQHVFLDGGSNRGVHIRSLFEPVKFSGLHNYWRKGYQNSVAFTPFYNLIKRIYNTTNPNETICAFGFEANPDYSSRLQALERSYRGLGWNVRWFNPTAVWVKNENLSFQSRDLGGHVKSIYSTKEGVVTVGGIDFALFVQQHIVRRLLPVPSKPRYTVMKMDIEGSEFQVMAHLARHHVLCQGAGIDALTIEYHYGRVKVKPDAQYFHEEWQRLAVDTANISRTEKCQFTSILDWDSEAHANDDTPLPTGEAVPRVKQLPRR